MDEPQQPIQPTQPTSDYERWLGQYAFRQPMEKTFIDKLLSRREVTELQNLIMKEDLTRRDLLKLLYMLTSAELKLSNLGEYDRYLLGKYFTWVRDLVKVAEFLYDYVDQIEQDKVKFSAEGKKEILDTLDQVKKMFLHDVKFSADIFLFLTRSSLALTGIAFDTLSKQRFEYEYGGQYPNLPQPQPSSRGWNPFKR